MGYTNKTIQGFGWHSTAKIAATILSLLKIIIIARLLSPSDFGIFSLATIALGLTEAATQTGINTTIIQSKQSINYFLNTAWVIAIIRGLIIAVLMLLMGLMMSKFFQEQQLLFLIGLASLIPIIKGFINPSIVSLHKEMRFFGDSMYRFLLVVSDTFFAVLLTWILHSVFALILAMLITSLFEVAISFFFFSNRPKFEFVKSRAKVILSNAKWLNLLSFLSYTNENVDNFLIGKIAGVRNLGLYHNAYSLSHRSYEIFAKAAHHSSFPALVKLTHQPDRFARAAKRILLSSMSIILLVSLPFFLFPELITTLILGDQWLEVIPLLRLLVLASIVHSFTSISYAVFLSTKQYLFMQTHLVLSTIMLVLLIVILGTNFGLMGAVWAVIFSRIIALPIIVYGLHHVIQKQ